MHPSRHLALVANRPEPERDPDEAQRAMAQRLEEILRQSRPVGAAVTTHPSSHALAQRMPPDSLPTAVRLTMTQILEVAEDAEIRAVIIDDVASTLDPARDGAFIPLPDGLDLIQRRVDSLREVARDLRGIAAQIIDGWAGPERSM